LNDKLNMDSRHLSMQMWGQFESL